MIIGGGGGSAIKYKKCALNFSYFCSDIPHFKKNFRKIINIKFYENPSSGSRRVPCGWRDMKQLIMAFRNSAKAPKEKKLT
jgi:hypothetical protein